MTTRPAKRINPDIVNPYAGRYYQKTLYEMFKDEPDVLEKFRERHKRKVKQYNQTFKKKMATPLTK